MYSSILALQPPNQIYYGSRSPQELLKASGLTQVLNSKYSFCGSQNFPHPTTHPYYNVEVLVVLRHGMERDGAVEFREILIVIRPLGNSEQRGGGVYKRGKGVYDHPWSS